jgi:sulfite oxidase
MGLIVHSESPYNAESPRRALAAADLTPVEDFYVRTHAPAVPERDAGAWRLHVDGLVGQELSLSLADLRGFPAREVVATLQCAGNRRAGLIAVREIPGEAPWGAGATGTARFGGTGLGDVLAAAGLQGGARHVELLGADVSGEAEPPQVFGASITRHKALAPEVLLAWEMNGAPLTPLHGAPLRAVVPGYIGARSVKWLERVTARTEPSENFFQARTYRLLPADDPGAAGVPLGAIAVNADVLMPDDGDTVPAGRLEVAGYALSGDDRRIVRVDVSTDAGAHWREAELLAELSPWAWRRWRIALDVAPGPLEIVARAWDSAASTQPEHPEAVWNPKGYANNSWARVSINVS